MRITDAVRICDKLLDQDHKIFTTNEEAAVRCVVRFIKLVVKARVSIRELSNALELDLNQEDLFK